MTDSAAIQQRTNALGIADSYWDVDGNQHVIDDNTLRYFIQAFEETTVTESAFSNVVVLPVEKAHALPISPRPEQCHLLDEYGCIVNQACFFDDANQLTVPALSMGYYTLRIENENTTTQWRLIVAPETCYQPPALKKRCLQGLTLQLYSLRSDCRDILRSNWGIGDFSDLRDAVTLAMDKGWDFIGINPLHDLYPERPEWASPYSPSSRVWKNWLYLSIEQIPEFSESPENLAWFAAHQAEIEQIRQADTIDYTAVSDFKKHALMRAFSAFDDYAGEKRRAEFQHFIEQSGEALTHHAAFHTIQGYQARGEWQAMGYDISDIHSPDLCRFVQDEAETILFYSYLQWLVDQQLKQVQQYALDCGLALGLYGDLAVGVAQGSADSWVNPALYSFPASIGAPPDPLGPVGQNWGLPPMHPDMLEQQGFQPFIDLLRANMRHVGALRIDHVMGLYRLWLIPEGKDASHGAYVHYPFDTLMAILALESQRAKCLVIGEDLGTVPDVVRETLCRYQVLSYDVLYFGGRYDDKGWSRWRKPADVGQQALAVVGTHDLPPLAGWWHCRDLDLLGELGILDDNALKPMYDARLHDKQALLNALKADGYLPENYDIDALKMAMHDQLNWAIHAYADDGNTQLFGIQPENFCGVDWAFNVPGTTTEVPNWRRKLPCSLTDIAFAK